MTKPRTLGATAVLPWNAPRDAWLAARRTLIGSSDIADVIGVGRHDPYTVWLDKTGRLPDAAPNMDMARGIDLEAAVIRHWVTRHATDHLRVRRAGLMRSRRYRRAGATVDRRSTCDAGRCITEAKTQIDIRGWGDAVEPEVPVDFQFQGLWQAGVMGVDHVHFVVMGPRFVPFERVMAFDGDLFEWMLCEAARFWGRHVITDRPPEATADAAEVIKHLWPEPARGETYELDGRAADLMHVIARERATVDRHQRSLDDAAAALQALVGPATEILWPDEVVAATWRPTKAIDGASDEWRAANPEIVARYAKRYTVDRAVYGRLLMAAEAGKLPPDLGLALQLAEATDLDLGRAARDLGELPEGLAYRRQFLVKPSTAPTIKED